MLRPVLLPILEPVLHFGLTSYRGGGGAPWSPASLFANGEQGAWYDPSDLSTVFQNTVGTIPALPGDPVGLVLDKSGNGVNLSQPTASARPTLARMPKTGRRNLLTWTEEFDNAAWTKTSCTVTDLGDGVFRLQAAAGSWALLQSVATNGLNCTMGFDVKSNGAGLDDAQLIMSGLRLQPFSATSDWQRVNVTGLHNNNGAANGIFPLAGKAVDILIRFPHLELGSIATPYQRVTNAFDVHEDGVPDCYYLRPDLTDDALTTVLPQAVNGDILIAGTTGSIIEPVNYAASSTFTLGPDTYTGGTPGVMSAVGGVVGLLLIDRTLTQNERDNLLSYYADKGAGGLLP